MAFITSDQTETAGFSSYLLNTYSKYGNNKAAFKFQFKFGNSTMGYDTWGWTATQSDIKIFGGVGEGGPTSPGNKRVS